MSFQITTPPSTDIWRKPPSKNAFNAPTRLGSLGTLNSFISTRITFSLPHRSELIKYDQGGILLLLKKPGIPAEKGQWIKTGIEYYLSEPWVGTVCCDRWADWSITPLVVGDNSEDLESPTATIEAERARDELGKSLWIYLIVKKNGKEERIPLREVNWVFAEEEEVEIVLSVSAYAARPLKKEGNESEELTVSFKDFDVQWE